MTDLSSFSRGLSDRFGPAGPDGPVGQAESGQPGEPIQPDELPETEQTPESPGTDEPTHESGAAAGAGEPAGPDGTGGPVGADQHTDASGLPVFVDDPIVPLRLRLPDGIRHTLYHPGWYGIEDDEESQAFLGVPGEVLYGFEKLTHLVDYMRTGAPTGLAPGPDLAAVLSWTAQDYAKRLCDYDMVAIPELANGELSADEQGSVGSLLAVGLDLMDFLRIGGEHADALRQDEDVSKLAAGDEVLSIFAAGRHRHHVVEMIDTHWGPCMAEVSARTTVPGTTS